MNWRKDWRKAFCTLLIVTAEAQRVYDATRPRTRKPGPGFAGIYSLLNTISYKKEIYRILMMDRNQLSPSLFFAAMLKANLCAFTYYWF